jgi:hypothetical protein
MELAKPGRFALDRLRPGGPALPSAMGMAPPCDSGCYMDLTTHIHTICNRSSLYPHTPNGMYNTYIR